MAGPLDDFLGGYQAPKVTVTVTARADLLDEHKHANEQLGRAAIEDVTLAGSTIKADWAAKVVELEAQIAASSMSFTFRSIGRKAWMTLVAQHPPRPQDKGLDYDADAFPEAAVLASCIEPELTPADVERLTEVLSLAQWMKLWNGALAANLGDDAAPKSLIATAVHRLSDASSTTAAREASPEASSLAEP